MYYRCVGFLKNMWGNACLKGKQDSFLEIEKKNCVTFFFPFPMSLLKIHFYTVLLVCVWHNSLSVQVDTVEGLLDVLK